MRTSTAAAISAAWFLAPTTVSYGIPWLITRWETSYDWGHLGPAARAPPPAVLVLVGAPIPVHAFVRFVREGRGTPMLGLPPPVPSSTRPTGPPSPPGGRGCGPGGG